MLIFPMMLYLSTIMTGRCYIQPAADVVPAPGIDYSCTAPILPDPPSPPTTIGVKRPPFPTPPPGRPCGCEKDERPEPKPLPLLFLPKVILIDQP